MTTITRRPTYPDAVQRALLSMTPDQRAAFHAMDADALTEALDTFVKDEEARERWLNLTAGMGTTFAPASEVRVTERVRVTYRAYYDGSPLRTREMDEPRPNAGHCVTYCLASDIATRRPVKGDVLRTVLPSTISKRGRIGEGRPKGTPSKQRKYASSADRQRAYRERKRQERERQAAGTIDLTNA